MKKIVLLDLDGTVLNRDYQITVPEKIFKSSIKKFQSSKFVIGISSDSAADTIVKFMQVHGIIGPVIAEKGAFLIIKAKGFTNGVNTISETVSFTTIRKILLKKFYENVNTLTVIGDVNRLSRFFQKIPNDAGSVAKRAVLINGMRRGSLSFYAYGSKEGHWQKDARALKEVLAEVLEIIKKNFPALKNNIFVDLNSEYGICIIHHKNTKKALALPGIKKKYDGYRIFVIGDSVGDFYSNRLVTHCAVANASAEYKKVCSIVAKKEYSAGVIELLEKIARLK